MRTLADLAAQQGVRLQSYLNAGPHKAAGFPAPINEGRNRLYDGEQVDTYLAGRPVPALPDVDDDQDLLDRKEAAAAWGVSPRSWDSYKREPQVAAHQVVVGGVEHWPRGIVREVKAARPGKTAGTGRPKNVGDQVPRDQILERTAPLLDADPAVSAAAVTDTLGIHTTADQAAHPLGYPTSQIRRRHRARRHRLARMRRRPYLTDISQGLHAQDGPAPWTAHRPAVGRRGVRCRTALGRFHRASPYLRVGRTARLAHRRQLAQPIGPGGSWPRPRRGIRRLAASDLITTVTS